MAPSMTDPHLLPRAMRISADSVTTDHILAHTLREWNTSAFYGYTFQNLGEVFR